VTKHDSEIFYPVSVITNDYTTLSELTLKKNKNGKAEFLFKNCQKEHLTT